MFVATAFDKNTEWVAECERKYDAVTTWAEFAQVSCVIEVPHPDTKFAYLYRGELHGAQHITPHAIAALKPPAMQKAAQHPLPVVPDALVAPGRRVRTRKPRVQRVLPAPLGPVLAPPKATVWRQGMAIPQQNIAPAVQVVPLPPPPPQQPAAQPAAQLPPHGAL
jgi:hypothetical protein